MLLAWKLSAIYLLLPSLCLSVMVSPVCAFPQCVCVCVCVSVCVCDMVTGILLYMDKFLSCAYHFLSFCTDLSLPWTACTHPISNCEHWQWIIRWITMWATNMLANKIRWTPRSTEMELARNRMENKVAGKTTFSATIKTERLQMRLTCTYASVFSTAAASLRVMFRLNQKRISHDWSNKAA